MKKVFTIVLMAAALLVANGQVKAQATKFGYISVNELMESMPEMKKADSALQQFREALIQSARDKEATLNEGITKFNADSSKMSPAVKEVKRTELQKKLQELQGEDQRIQQELEKKQQELLAPLQKKALDAINAVAKESNYAYVFIKDALIVSPPADDIAPLVKKKLGITK